MQQPSDFSERWIQHQRQHTKTTHNYTCKWCRDRKVFSCDASLWSHALVDHLDQLPAEEGEALEAARKEYVSQSAPKKPSNDSQPRKPTLNEANRAGPEPPPHKRPLSTPTQLAPTRSLSALSALHLETPKGSEDVVMHNDLDSSGEGDQPRKRAAIGDGISAGSASPFREQSTSPPPRRSNARPYSAPYGVSTETENRKQDMADVPRPQVAKKKLWTPEQDTPIPRASFDPSNIASVQAQKSRQAMHAQQQKSRRTFPSTPQSGSSKPVPSPSSHSTAPSVIFSRPNTTQSPVAPQREEVYEIILQPETRPISQEQLVAEVKGIYAGLVMVEAKCIEVDNKQATLAQADPSSQPKLNNEQWQALIALHRTLLHEHHDFFLASQHPSASPALRRLASKYAMPARMWRHGIHSFLELLRHRLPASLDHMLAFIYLAYSMMALLYETVPAFEDTWIECLGDLGRYRMAIEDDDIRDREVWTGVARHWYSKASDKAPTTGRLYHHLAILARPNALQQLFYYSKSLCVAIPFTSARESVLTLFDPVINADNSHVQYRLPPLDTAFVKAHGHLFTNREIEKFEPALAEFLALLDNQIGRVTRKFMEQGYHIAIANNVAMLGFAAKENMLMKAISPAKDTDVEMTSSVDELSVISFKHAQRLSNSTLSIVLRRIGDPNVLPFIHVTLAFMHYMSCHPAAMSFLETEFPWELLSTMLNTLLVSHPNTGRIENDLFPLPEKDDVRPFPEDFAMRGLLWTENYFPDGWFTNEKIDEEEKSHERASMTAQRKERILWLACRIASAGAWIKYDGKSFLVPLAEPEIIPIETDSRSSTFASATTADRSETWGSTGADIDNQSDAEEDLPSSEMPAAQSTHYD